MFLCSIKVFTQEVESTKYRRSSLYSLMLTDKNREHEEAISKAFLSSSIPEKFNDHNLKERTIIKLPFKNDSLKTKKKKSFFEKVKGTVASKKKERKEFVLKQIEDFLKENSIAKSLIAKWFNRSSTGGFNTGMVVERGFYNASEIDKSIAEKSQRGQALLADAGEELIANTFVVINDFAYTDKEELANDIGKGITLIKRVKNKDVVGLTTTDNTASATSVEGLAGKTFGKGYVVKTTSYLYRLEWNDDVAANFYYNYWTSDESLNEKKKKEFDSTSIFNLKYIGHEIAWADVQSTVFTKKSNKELIEIATRRAADNVIAKLQKKYDVFKTKSPLTNVDPLAAKIGLKEGVTPKTKFEVLEQILHEDGTTEYKRIGQITPIDGSIWDNQYLAEEEKETDQPYTVFKTYGLGSSATKFYPGLLIRQIKN